MNYKARADWFTEKIHEHTNDDRYECRYDPFLRVYYVIYKLSGNPRFHIQVYTIKENVYLTEDVVYFHPCMLALNAMRKANPRKTIASLKPKTLFKYR